MSDTAMHLKLLGLEPQNEEWTEFHLKKWWFAAIFDDFTSRCFHAPEIKTLEWFDNEYQQYVMIFKVIGGLEKNLYSTHVALRTTLVVRPATIDLLTKTRPASIKTLASFTVPEWREK